MENIIFAVIEFAATAIQIPCSNYHYWRVSLLSSSTGLDINYKAGEQFFFYSNQVFFFLPWAGVSDIGLEEAWDSNTWSFFPFLIHKRLMSVLL